MKGRLLIVIFISICFIAGSCNVSSVQGSRYNFSLLDSFIQGWVSKEYYPGASICVVKNDSLHGESVQRETVHAALAC